MDDKILSKPEDGLLRQWIRKEYGIQIPQWSLWKLTPAEALDLLKERDRATFGKLTVDNIRRAARRPG